MLNTRTPAPASVLGRARHRLDGRPLLRHLLLALAGLLLVVLVLESTSSLRHVQLATMAYTGIAAGGLSLLLGLSPFCTSFHAERVPSRPQAPREPPSTHLASSPCRTLAAYGGVQ